MTPALLTAWCQQGWCDAWSCLGVRSAVSRGKLLFANLWRSTPLRYDAILTISVTDIYSLMSKPGPQVPLTPAVFHILLALVGQYPHGYDMMQQVKSDFLGRRQNGAGNVVRLAGPHDRSRSGDARVTRRTRAEFITSSHRPGWRRSRAETERLSHLAIVARRQLGTA